LLKGLLSLGYFGKLIFSGLAPISSPLGRFFFRSVILPLYGRYLWLKSKLIKVAPEKKDRLLIIFTNRYLVHFLILMLGLGVVASNIMAYETKEDYGQNALIYKIAGVSDSLIVEDTNVISVESKAYNYQQQGTFVEGNSFAEADNSDSDNIYTDLATTQGDLALLKPDIVNTQEAKSPLVSIKEYTVAEGDTISKVASKFGVSVNTILWANNLSFSSYVKPGQKLIIPSVSGVIYKIVKGDTLSKISQKYGISASKISEANSLTTEGLIVGNSLIIPGGKIIETAKPRTIAQTAGKTPVKVSGSNVTEVSGTGRMSWPSSCQRISQYYKGWRHTGVDIACPWGTALRAADGGRVIRVQYGRTGYGYNVIIDHGGGISTLYGHMSSIDVVVGQYVERGEVIGDEGSTGRSTGPHLHFEVRINGSMVNPLSYIR
jgi:murein DD-endopeptidase MepM/ murein hydrolase activator NlpD